MEVGGCIGQKMCFAGCLSIYWQFSYKINSFYMVPEILIAEFLSSLHKQNRWKFASKKYDNKTCKLSLFSQQVPVSPSHFGGETGREFNNIS